MDLKLDEFIEFNDAPLSNISEGDALFLKTQGIPRDASPFLSFEAYSVDEILQRARIFGIPENYYPIGHNGSGDVIAIESTSGEDVYFNHDSHNQRVFINSSLLQFAESLCLYQEHLSERKIGECLVAIEGIDKPAVNPGNMWYSEIIAELEDGQQEH